MLRMDTVESRPSLRMDTVESRPPLRMDTVESRPPLRMDDAESRPPRRMRKQTRLSPRRPPPRLEGLWDRAETKGPGRGSGSPEGGISSYPTIDKKGSFDATGGEEADQTLTSPAAQAGRKVEPSRDEGPGQRSGSPEGGISSYPTIDKEGNFDFPGGVEADIAHPERDDYTSEEIDKSATLIQACWRSFRVRECVLQNLDDEGRPDICQFDVALKFILNEIRVSYSSNSLALAGHSTHSPRGPLWRLSAAPDQAPLRCAKSP